jgi:hypothetical protein
MPFAALKSIGGQRFDSIMDFMRDIQSAGFLDEFDNSLIMRMIWDKIAEIEKALSVCDSKIYFTTEAQMHLTYGTILNVTMHSSMKEDISATMELFLRDGRLTASSNVLLEEIKPRSTDVPAHGVYWPEAERLFKTNKHFDNMAFKAFKATYRALTLRGDALALRLLITPMHLGWRVEYRIHGKKVMVMQFEFNK